MKDKLLTFIWFILLITVIVILAVPASRESFSSLTISYPYLMGIFKIALLGTLGELLGGKIVKGKWKIRNNNLALRILVWGFLGFVFTAVFPLFSYGVEGLLQQGLLPGEGTVFLTAFWKSFFMNLLFGFPMMVFHRFTDTLIDHGRLFSIWPVTDTFRAIDWKNMFRVVGTAIFWFWIPAHTITFLLPAEFRVMSAALLAIVLGIILGMAKKMSAKTQ